MAQKTTDYRMVIRHTNRTPIEKFERCYNSFMRYFNECITGEVANRNQGCYNLLESLYVLYKLMNLFADFYFQIVLYLLIDNISKEDKILKMRLLVEHAAKLENEFVPRTEKAEKHNIFDSFAVYIMYLDYRNICRNVIDIQELLMKQMQDGKYNKYVKEEY